MDECSWSDLLPANPLFERLRENGCQGPEGANVICEVRGDLLVWIQGLEALLTTNLKRLKANPDPEEDQVYQLLLCTSPPLSPVLRLLPDRDGVHVALQCADGLSVVRLARHRGEFGEFGAGTHTVNCKTTPIAPHLFLVQRHSLRLLQAAWHPTRPGAICMLTSDSTIRVYSLADPNIAMATIPQGGQSHSRYNLGEDHLVAFSLAPSSPPSPPSIFLLRDSGDVHTSSLTPHAPLSSPLRMLPDEETNYGYTCSILSLPTSPAAVVIANKNGKIYHCIFMPSEQQEEGSPNVPDTLYVVECVELELTIPTDDTEISLMADPNLHHRYFAVHHNGVHMVFLPWLAQMEAFAATAADAPLVVDGEAEVEHLLATEPGVNWPQGVAIITEPLLGSTLVCLTSDLQCVCYPIPAGASPTVPSLLPRLHTPTREPDRHLSGLEETVHSILRFGDEEEEGEESSPVIRSSGRRETTQEECLRFLTQSIDDLRKRHILRQKRAKDELKYRIEVLVRQKHQQFEDLVRLQDEAGVVTASSKELQERLEEQSVTSQQLSRRVEQLMCQLETFSPVLSEAEERMGRELEGMLGKMALLERRLVEARAKLEILRGLKGRGSVGPSLSARHIQTVLATLTESGQSIKFLKDQIKSLASMTPT